MSSPEESPRDPDIGFTVIEMMVVTSLIAILASIAVPLYFSSLRNARIAKAAEELRMISGAIGMFRARHHGILPVTLAEVGHRGRLDPWGYPYMYLSFTTGTGSGMDWALKNDLIDPGDLRIRLTVDQFGIADSTADFDFNSYERVKDGLANEFPRALGVGITVDEVKRKDRRLSPLNTDFDLFSMGSDGVTAVSLADTKSVDDVVRGLDGGFFGLARNY